MLEEMEGPDGPPLLLFPVQLLQRISPWFPFLHIEEEFVLQTAQHGFKPNGIVNGQNTTQQCCEIHVSVRNNKTIAVWSAPANCVTSNTQLRPNDTNREEYISPPETELLWETGYGIRLIRIITAASKLQYVFSYFCIHITAIAKTSNAFWLY